MALSSRLRRLPLPVRGIERVRLHADLTILAKLGCALASAAEGRAHGVDCRAVTVRASLVGPLAKLDWAEKHMGRLASEIEAFYAGTVETRKTL